MGNCYFCEESAKGGERVRMIAKNGETFTAEVCNMCYDELETCDECGGFIDVGEGIHDIKTGELFCGACASVIIDFYERVAADMKRQRGI